MTKIPTSFQAQDSPRKVFVFRHAERVDTTFNRRPEFHWMDGAIDEHGNYKPFNLNMPKYLPNREGGHQEFRDDTPLTELGYHHAVLTGKALAHKGVEIHHVFSSPALRCVQTANGIIEGLKSSNLKINIDIGLYEWTKFYEFLPNWMTLEEHLEAEHSVNPMYKSFYERHELNMDETIDDWFNRSHDITKKILNITQGNVLIIGHRSSLYSCTTQLCGLPIPNEEDSDIDVLKVQYLDGIHIEEHDEAGKYKYAKLPIPKFSCSNFSV